MPERSNFYWILPLIIWLDKNLMKERISQIKGNILAAGLRTVPFVWAKKYYVYDNQLCERLFDYILNGFLLKLRIFDQV